MNFEKESKSRIFFAFLFSFYLFFFFGGGGGGGGGRGYGRYEHESRQILYTRHIVTTSSTEPYSFMKIILTVFKIESIDGIAA